MASSFDTLTKVTEELKIKMESLKINQSIKDAYNRPTGPLPGGQSNLKEVGDIHTMVMQQGSKLENLSTRVLWLTDSAPELYTSDLKERLARVETEISSHLRQDHRYYSPALNVGSI